MHIRLVRQYSTFLSRGTSLFLKKLLSQKSPVHAVQGPGRWHNHTQTDIATYRLNRRIGRFSEIQQKINKYWIQYLFGDLSTIITTIFTNTEVYAGLHSFFALKLFKKLIIHFEPSHLAFY